MNGNVLDFILVLFSPCPEEKVDQNRVDLHIISAFVFFQHLLGSIPDQFTSVYTAPSDLHLPSISAPQHFPSLQRLRDRGRVGNGAGERERLRDAIIGEHRHFVQIVEMTEPTAGQAAPDVGHHDLSAFVETDADVFVVVVEDGLVAKRREILDEDLNQFHRRPSAGCHAVVKGTVEVINQPLANLMQNLQSFVEKWNLLGCFGAEHVT